MTRMGIYTPQIEEYLRQFRNGDRDEAFFGLLEMEHEVLRDLITIFRIERDSCLRAFLVEVIWQHRQTSSVSFLGEALEDSAPEVWKQALDGLVTLSSVEALDVLRAARSQPLDSVEFHRWVEEAIEQVESEIKRV